ncbi:MAG: isoniazid response ATPase/transcriptional regulator IniR [Mycolicibacterium sp.]|uniref:isoniazid response ATPase/transcriptional regulator IniR n=1 Tax=Mycolicibacterium sp. TaxID=2320850 RepID=UPI003D12CA43
MTTELPSAAREAVAAVEADPAAATRLLVTGGIGTGKTATIAAVRAAFLGSGRPVLSRPPRDPEADNFAIVIDDVDLLDDDDLNRLTDLVAEPDATVVIATQPLAHHPALRRLTVALHRENPTVLLGGLAPVEVEQAVAARLGSAPAPELVRLLVSATAGLPFLLPGALAAVAEGTATDLRAGRAGGAAADTRAAVARAADFALIERLRGLEADLLDTLLVCSLSLDLGPDDVAAALGMSGGQSLNNVDRARSSGLIEPSHPPSFMRKVHTGVAQVVGTARHHEVELAVLQSQLELSTLTAELALRMAEHGLRDQRLAAALTDLASRTQDPAPAMRLYRAAAEAGASPSAKLADALALAGDCAAAGRIADALLTSEDPRERTAAVRIAASIALHDGRAGQANDLFGWLGPPQDAVASAAATISALAAGDGGVASSTVASSTVAEQSAGPPTSAARAARALTEGLLLTFDRPYRVAVAELSQSLGTDLGREQLLPDTPAALVTLTALHGGDPVRAHSVPEGRNVLAGLVRDANVDGSEPTDANVVTPRRRLLLGWAYMQDGQLAAAGAAVASVKSPLNRRDALWAAALRTAIARRTGDSGAMRQHWQSGSEVLDEYSPDLFTLLPLGELWVAAARLRTVDRLQLALEQALGLLAALGDPVLWSVPLQWAGVQAGILSNSPDAVAPHGQALAAAASQSPFAAALATAGRTWLRVLANRVDVDDVTVAARGLAQYGHTWDATRLAGQAALQTPDQRVSQAMLQLARDLKQSVDAPEPVVAPSGGSDGAPAATGNAAAGPRRTARLSDREYEVAELLVQGMPYRDIGAQLFISAKTVEHHVARIRRRLGAQSRSEMLSMLRATLASSG